MKFFTLADWTGMGGNRSRSRMEWFPHCARVGPGRQASAARKRALDAENGQAQARGMTTDENQFSVNRSLKKPHSCP